MSDACSRHRRERSTLRKLLLLLLMLLELLLLVLLLGCLLLVRLLLLEGLMKQFGLLSMWPLLSKLTSPSCSRAMARGLEKRVLDGVNARPWCGCGSFCRGPLHWIRGWGLPMGSIPAVAHW